MNERAAAFRLWLENPCWGEVKEMMAELREKSIRAEDVVPTAELSVQVIAEGRGIRRALADLLRKIEEAAS